MPGQPVPSGYLNAAGAVVFSRWLPQSRAQGWAAVTDPVRTARWIGPWTGDPSTGTVELMMTAEEGSPVSTVEILRCEAPGLVIVATGGWRLTVRIDDDDDPADIGRTVLPTHVGASTPTGADASPAPDPETHPAVRISLEHHIDDAESAASIGPGWDYYLDRLVEAEAGRDADALRFSPDYFPALAAHYRALLGG